jgi:hypothetical protein
VRAVRRRLRSDHRDTITAVIEAGERVVTGIDTWPVTDGSRIREPLRRELTDRALLEPILGLLATGSDALGETVDGSPVTAPPYLVVTSHGPLCRGTLESGRRLLVELGLFAVERRPRRYRFRDPDVEECLGVRLG